jgi:hypothetical protein
VSKWIGVKDQLPDSKGSSPQLDPNSRYPKGSIWQDESSIKEDGLIDFYLMNDKWEFFKRDKPIYFFKPAAYSSEYPKD